jgi:hypothetical protein
MCVVRHNYSDLRKVQYRAFVSTVHYISNYVKGGEVPNQMSD